MAILDDADALWAWMWWWSRGFVSKPQLIIPLNPLSAPGGYDDMMCGGLSGSLIFQRPLLECCRDKSIFLDLPSSWCLSTFRNAVHCGDSDAPKKLDVKQVAFTNKKQTLNTQCFERHLCRCGLSVVLAHARRPQYLWCTNPREQLLQTQPPIPGGTKETHLQGTTHTRAPEFFQCDASCHSLNSFCCILLLSWLLAKGWT